MSDVPRHLRLLEKQLASLPGEPMLASELNGFLTGVLVCPDLIMPSEWLPMVWGAYEDDDAPAFENSRQVEKLVGLVMEHYNAIARELSREPGHYVPVLEVDTRTDEVLWELWIDGFEQAIQMRPDAWAKFLLSDEGTRTAWAGLVRLGEISRRETNLPQNEIDDLTTRAPDLIPDWVETLNAWRLRQGGRDPRPLSTSPSAKVGRNDPCPCGSGKKYKKCCGLN